MNAIRLWTMRLANSLFFHIFFRPFGTISSIHKTNGTIGPSYSAAVLLLWRSQSICLSFRFLFFYSMGSQNGKINQISKSFFLVTRGQIFWPGWSIAFIFQNLINFDSLGQILVLHIPVLSIDKFHFLEQFPMDCFSHAFMHCLVLLFC